ncbi:MAG: GNAT family N-acetyltransferase [Gemmatimonadetes bacterium]|nr:GNAT family N-acetyltransferase [Gemmatimonadota bacterium]
MPPIAVTRTYLELTASITPAITPPPPGTSWRVLDATAWDETRLLYTEVGADYAWRDRLPWSEAQWAELVASPSTRVFVLDVDERPGGYAELSTVGRAIEIAYFGLKGFAQGRGLGRWMLERAIAEAQAMGAERVWLHTCTLDAPAALPNYLARGFSVVRTETYTVEVPDA